MSRDENAPERSAGVPPAGARASRPRFGEVTVRNRGRLPHWEMESGWYFVTFRLCDSLPKNVLEELEERSKRLRLTKERESELLRQIEKYLDRGAGECWLRRPEIASIVAAAIAELDGKKYRLLAWVIMPNHVHLIFRLLPGHALPETLHSLKSFTSKQANAVLRRSGAFWQREYYDHLLRGEGSLEKAVHYVLTNPERAGLKNWNWVGDLTVEDPESPRAGGTRPSRRDAGATR